MAKEYIERGAVYQFMFDIPNPDGAGEIEVVSVDDLDAIPAADVVPVVRCGKCRIWDKHWIPNYSRDNEHFCPFLGIVTHADWYCAYGAGMDIVTYCNQVKDGDGE